MADGFSLFQDWDGFVSALGKMVDLETSVRRSGALRRCRRIKDAQGLLRLAMLYGPCGLSLRSVSAWAAAHDMARLSDVAVLKRLRGASGWLETLCRELLRHRLEGGCGDGHGGVLPCGLPALAGAGARHVSWIDGTTVMDGGLRGMEWRLHCRYSAARGFEEITITDRYVGETLRHYNPGAGDIVVADRGYARSGGLLAVHDAGADFVVRCGWRALALCRPDGRPFDMIEHLRGMKGRRIDDITLAMRAAGRLVPLRLIITPGDEAARRRDIERLRRKRRQNGRRGDVRSLEAAGFCLVVTSLDRRVFDADAVLALYRTRRQIELAFKRLKSLIRIDRLPARDPTLVRTWLYSHLILALMIETLSSQALESPPSG